MKNERETEVLRSTGENQRKRGQSFLVQLFRPAAIYFVMLIITAFHVQSTLASTHNKMHLNELPNIPVLSISPDQKFIAFSFCEKTCGILEKNIKSGEMVLYQVSNGSGLQAPSYSPDGRYLAVLFSHQGVNKIYRSIAIVDREKHSVIQITDGEHLDFSPTFSEDGKSIVFTRAANEKKTGRVPVKDFDAYLVKIDSNSIPERLTNLALGSMSRPLLLGGTLFFSSVGKTVERIYSFDTAKGVLDEISTGLGEFAVQGVSISSQVLIAIKRLGSSFSVVTLKRNGSVIDEVFDDYYIGRASISERGGLVAYVRNNRNRLELVLVDLKSKNRSVFDLHSQSPSKAIILEMQK